MFTINEVYCTGTVHHNQSVELAPGDSYQIRVDKDDNVFLKTVRAKDKKAKIDKWLLFWGLMGWGGFLAHSIWVLIPGAGK